MITIGQPQHLGKRTLILYASRKATIGIVMLLISFAVATIGQPAAAAFAGLLASGGSFNPDTVAVIEGYFSSFSVLLFLASIMILLIGIIIALVEYRNYVFVLDEFSLKFHRGIFNQEEISIPYRQIQDIDLVRTIQHRLFGVSRLIMITAGHDEAKETDDTNTIFDPIDADLASEIRQFMERKIGVQVIQTNAQADDDEKAEEKGAPAASPAAASPVSAREGQSAQ
jgi:uncharacterized membrane protein YdbT with pleckstrin-like domain